MELLRSPAPEESTLTSGMHPNGEMLLLGTRSPSVEARYDEADPQCQIIINRIERPLDPLLGVLLFTAAQTGDGLNMYVTMFQGALCEEPN